MEIIWEGETGDTGETAFRLVMNDEGLLMFQRRSLDHFEWEDVDGPDDEPVPQDFQFGRKPRPDTD